MSDEPAPAPVCPKCGRELPALAIACRDCVKQGVLEAMLEQEREAWTNGYFFELELSRERGRAQHLVLKVDWDLTYCAERATEARKKRRHVNPDHLPEGICRVCLDNFQRMRQRAGEVGAR